MLVTTTGLTGGMGGTLRMPKLPPGGPPLLALLALALTLALATRGRRSLRRPLGAALAILAVGAALTLAACPSTSTGNTTPDLANAGSDVDMGDPSVDLGTAPADLASSATPTPPGSYQLQLTATSGSVTSSLPLTLTVQ